MLELTLGEFAKNLSYLIDNNKRLIDKGDTPIAVCLEGEAGIGKTAIVQQLAEDKGMTFVKINLAQIEEPAELIGFPYKEYKITKDGEEQWVSSEILQLIEGKFTPTNESRMSYAVPSWVPREFNPNGTMLVLDDFTRANSLILQAVMEIINTGSYVSWNLPKYTNIVLTSNPSNGSYTVSEIDSAMKSRMITYHGKFNISEWAHWAELAGIDGRAINFALLYENEIFHPCNGVVLANARNYTTFCRAISGLDDWANEESLSLILQIASGCFIEKENTLGGLFTSFINNRLDKLVTPERILKGAWNEVSKELQDAVYQDGKYRADIASVLGSRFLNYCDKNFKSEKGIGKIIEDRITALIDSEVQLFSQDILYSIVKALCKSHVSQTNNWFLNTKIRKIAL